MLAPFSAMYRESSTRVANIAGGSACDASKFRNRFASSVTGITSCDGTEFLKALLYSIIRETVVIRQKSECKHSNKVFQWIFSGDSNRRDIENGIVYFGWEWRGGGCFFASRFKMRRCILSIVQDIGAPIGEDRKKGLIMDRMMEMLLCFCYFLRIIFVILLPSIISYQ